MEAVPQVEVVELVATMDVTLCQKGREAITTTVVEGTTVEAMLTLHNIQPVGLYIAVNGEAADLDQPLHHGAIVSVVRPFYNG